MNNLELSISFIVGVIIVGLIMGLFVFYSNFYNSKTINEINTISTMSIEEVIDYDFSKIGYRAGSNPVTSFDSSSIVFKSDLDNNGVIDTVQYSFKNGLTRLINPGEKTFTVPNVEKFSVTGYDSTNSQTTSVSDVKSIELKLTLNSKNQLSDTTFFANSYFEEIYFIKN
jgi:hypothetical protein